MTGYALLPSFHQNILRIYQPVFPRREHMHGARLELGDLRLGIERIVRQEIRGGFSDLLWGG